jgi:hypothetical protein
MVYLSYLQLLTCGTTLVAMFMPVLVAIDLY